MPVFGVIVANYKIEPMSSYTPAEDSEQPSSSEKGYSDLVERIQCGERAAVDELYGMVSRGLRLLLRRQLPPQDVDDVFHDTILAVVRGIQTRGLRNPDCLMGYVRTVMQRQVADHINKVTARRDRDIDIDCAPEAVDCSTPEQAMIRDQNAAILRTILRSLPRKYREVLTRFYILEQTAEQIMQEMELTSTQFRLLKSRAKAQFSKRGQRRFERRAARLTGYEPRRSLYDGSLQLRLLNRLRGP